MAIVSTQVNDPFGARSRFTTGHGTAALYRLHGLETAGLGSISRLPFSLRVLLESLLRNCDGEQVTVEDVQSLCAWNAVKPVRRVIPYKPARVILQDFTGVPTVVDLAAMRAAMKRMGGDPKRINPLVPVDLVIDHSVQIDVAGSPIALQKNAEKEFERNQERYEFLRWGQQAFDNFRVVPPATGIVHQVNLEFLATVVTAGNRAADQGGDTVVFPDTLVGTDSHTTMINGLGVLGWGVGGIEAEAAMLGQPYYFMTPAVVGFKLIGQLREGVTATDLVLTITEKLRQKGVVEKFVEFYGPGLAEMSLADRATVANMAPDYGATMGFFPVDDETLRYLRTTGREPAAVELVERYCKEQGLFRTEDTPDPIFSDTLELDLETVEPSLAGPKRPQDRVLLSDMQSAFAQALRAPVKERGYGLLEEDRKSTGAVSANGSRTSLTHGAVVIAAITSCTNTSNPSVMLGAGLLAKKAVERGLKVPSHVKTSLAPGSKVVTEYLRAAGLQDSLDQLGFNLVGYGCTTCIGNSGPLVAEVASAIKENNLVAAAVLSGNRNFEGRVHPLTKANYLASPPLVVAYALAGTVDINLTSDSLGRDRDGKHVYLRDIWPTQEEIRETLESSLKPEMFTDTYGNVFDGNDMWNRIPVTGGDLYEWQADSTYIQEPPFFQGLSPEPRPLEDIQGARVLVAVGDSVTTDHISPAGPIPVEGPAGDYLQSLGVQPMDFNSFGTRRGNDRVMLRGTFANIRLKNLLVPGSEGNVTRHFPDGEQMSVYDASHRYTQEGVPLMILAGKEYGTGSSRDWAAKGTLLLGVRTVLAESFERIHRANLIGMGVLPLQFQEGESVESQGLTGEETFAITGLQDDMAPGATLQVVAMSADGSQKSFSVVARLDSAVEVNYYRNGGILQTVLRDFAKTN